MKTQKCHSEERNKIEIVNSETARGEAWGTGGAGTRIWPWRRGKNMRQFRPFWFRGMCVLVPLKSGCSIQ